MTTVIVLVAVIIAIGVILATFGYIAGERRREFELQAKDFRTLLLQAIRKKGLANFNFADVLAKNETPAKVANHVAAELYADCCRKAVADGVISADEKKQLDTLRERLPLTREEADSIEAIAKGERFRAATREALADGELTPKEAADLTRLRTQLKLDGRTVMAAAGEDIRTGYIALFRDIAADGVITPEELQSLEQYRKAFSLTVAAAQEAIRSDALSLYRQWFANVVSDGVVTDEEVRGLGWLRDEFGLSGSLVSECEAEMREIRRLAAYRHGELPSLRTGRLLEGGEVSHWEGDCLYRWQTPTMDKEAAGLLIVTSKQIVFNSPQRSHSFNPAKIIDVGLNGRWVIIKTNSGRGTGDYRTADPATLEAVLVGLVRKHKFQSSARLSSTISRHIPDAVRREVWHRDGGRCVRCEDASYLEFDHIIPHTKGGANTVGNIQLLCRRCNNEKRDRI